MSVEVAWAKERDPWAEQAERLNVTAETAILPYCIFIPEGFRWTIVQNYCSKERAAAL
jgi:hypothetical protein